MKKVKSSDDDKTFNPMRELAEVDRKILAKLKRLQGLPHQFLATYKTVTERWLAEKRLKLARRKNTSAKSKPRVDPDRDLVHPHFKHREAELLAVLERDQECGERR